MSVVSNLYTPIYQRSALNSNLMNSGMINLLIRDVELELSVSNESFFGSVDGDFFVLSKFSDITEKELIEMDAEVEYTSSFYTEYGKMVRWEEFHKYVKPSVGSCPISIMDTAIQSACAEFCDKSHIWRQESITNDILEGTSTYAFSPPGGARVVTPYRVAINNKDLTPTDLETLETFTPDWRWAKAETPDRYFLVNDDVITLIGVPSKDIRDGLTAGVVLKPSRNSEGCPSFIYDDWAEVIASGALSKLLAMRGKLWAQEGLVAFYDKTFKAGIARAKSKSAKSWQRSTKDMLPVNFYE